MDLLKKVHALKGYLGKLAMTDSGKMVSILSVVNLDKNHNIFQEVEKMFVEIAKVLNVDIFSFIGEDNKKMFIHLYWKEQEAYKKSSFTFLWDNEVLPKLQKLAEVTKIEYSLSDFVTGISKFGNHRRLEPQETTRRIFKISRDSATNKNIGTKQSNKELEATKLIVIEPDRLMHPLDSKSPSKG